MKMHVLSKATKDGFIELARGKDKLLMEKAKKALEKATCLRLVLTEKEV